MQLTVNIKTEIKGRYLSVVTNNCKEQFIDLWEYINPLYLPELIVDIDYYEGRLN